MHGLQASLIPGAILSLPLHQVLMINDQLLDLALQPLVLMLQLDILLGLSSYLLMASFHFLLGLLVAPRKDQVLFSGSGELGGEVPGRRI